MLLNSPEVVRRSPKPVGPGVLTGSVGAALTSNPAGPEPTRGTIPSPVSGVPFITGPRFGELGLRSIDVMPPLTVVVAEQEVAFGAPIDEKKPGLRKWTFLSAPVIGVAPLAGRLVAPK